MARRPASLGTSLRNGLELAAVHVALATMAYIPRKWALAIGQFYAQTLDRLVPRLRRVALENLAFAFPERTARERSRLADEVFQSIGRVLTAFARFPSITSRNAAEWIRCEGREHVDRALERGRGLLFATAHLGNWELSAFAFAYTAQPISIVVRPLDNPLLDALVTRYRGLSGNRTITKRDYARGILKALSRNEMVGILADQNDSDGIYIDFFGRPAATSPGMAKLAARTGAVVVPGFALWSESECKYVLRFYPEVPISGDTRADTQRIHRCLEQVIREYPGQWLWIHRRWKTQPTNALTFDPVSRRNKL